VSQVAVVDYTVGLTSPNPTRRIMDEFFTYSKQLCDTIVDGEDPIDVLASRLMDVIYDDENFQVVVHRLVCRDLDLPASTVIGFTPEEAKEVNIEHYLSEDDPKYALYWETTSAVWNQLLAHCISKGKFRWTTEFTEKRHERYSATQVNQDNAAPAPQDVDLPVRLCDHGYVICAPCDFIPPSWKPQL
jgi:hypothetical protein